MVTWVTLRLEMAEAVGQPPMLITWAEPKPKRIAIMKQISNDFILWAVDCRVEWIVETIFSVEVQGKTVSLFCLSKSIILKSNNSLYLSLNNSLILSHCHAHRERNRFFPPKSCNRLIRVRGRGRGRQRVGTASGRGLITVRVSTACLETVF